MTEGKFLRLARVKAGLTQDELSRKLGFANCQFVSNIERGQSCLPPKKIKKLVAAIGINPDDLVRLKVLAYKKWLRTYL